MSGQAQWHQREQRAGEQRRGPRPTQHRRGSHRHDDRQERRPPPRVGGVHQTGDAPELHRVQVLEQRLARDVGDGQRHQQHRAAGPDQGGCPRRAQGAVAGHVEDAAALRGHQERREQESADGDHRGDLPSRPHERQPDRRRRAGIRQAGGGERVGERKHTQTSGHQSREHRDGRQHRPYRPDDTCGGRGHGDQPRWTPAGLVLAARAWPSSRTRWCPRQRLSR